MARRRMFSSDVVNQDHFLDMPADSQLLYFHLGMAADDEGFVSPKKVMRMVGASDDSLKLLILKGFVIPFRSGVVVITHWKQNNYLQKDRISPTIYQREKESILCIQNVYKLDTQYRVVRKGVREGTKISPKIREGVEEILRRNKN